MQFGVSLVSLMVFNPLRMKLFLLASLVVCLPICPVIGEGLPATDASVGVDADLIAEMKAQAADEAILALVGAGDSEGDAVAKVDAEPTDDVPEVEPRDNGDRARELAERLSNENKLFDEVQRRNLRDQVAEIRRLETELKLQESRLKAEMVAAEETLTRREIDHKLMRSELEAELATMEAENRRISVELELQRKRLEAETAALMEERQKLNAERMLREESLRSELAEMEEATQRRAMEIKEREQALRDRELTLQEKQIAFQTRSMDLDLELKEIASERQKAEAALAELESRIQFIRKERERERIVTDALEYPADPFADGVLRVSDRRIPLNGPIIAGTADYVARRIHFFNNKSKEAPIFIVIDSSPGGSAMEGYRILKAMEASEAPVHVVVKSFAASMAAIITTWADRSYAFPNAVILHHQPMTGAFGNVTEQREALETLEEWARRLLTPVAEKMDLSLEELYGKMYANSSTGDWDEFADRAAELRWVNTIVTELREEGIVEQPTDRAPVPWWFGLFGEAAADNVDPVAREFPKKLELPPLRPFDAYFIYNADGRYVW